MCLLIIHNGPLDRSMIGDLSYETVHSIAYYRCLSNSGINQYIISTQTWEIEHNVSIHAKYGGNVIAYNCLDVYTFHKQCLLCFVALK